ncbi:uncharacterized protein LOC114257150 isoform X1 [Camellia sinensis]|uniref:uncharacterized protein LOC114257150 isoform X1 n=3 Tax=Camellia sinensis TaxID=4442 RepID=UPI0010357EB3|nr:uncharacterized protein LOC114257150 isoform X1 [Camellia sinensis]
MDSDERLTDLKKAYADIILNTAKESAARILVSERKALRFQHELNVTKEQALQVLLRLKLMVDSKMSEAKTTSVSQQKKIEELEAQLQEAEDIVKDLREELREVQAELERVRKNKLHHFDEYDTINREPTLHEIKLSTSQSLESFAASDMKNLAFNQRNEVYKFYNVNENCIGNCYVGKPDLLPSSSEENRLNTSSQSVMFPPPESRLESFAPSDMKNSVLNQRNDFRMGNSYVSKPDLPSIILRSKESEPYRNRRTQRIRAFEEKLMAGELAFSDKIDDVNHETGGREGEEAICKTEEKIKSFRQKRRRVARYKKTKTASTKRLSNLAPKKDQTSDISCTVVNSVNNDAQSGGDPSSMAQRFSADTTDKGTPLGGTEATESDTEFVKGVSVENTTNDDKALQSGSAGVPSCGMDVEEVDMPVNLETKPSGSSNGILNQPVTRRDRVIKYTFQRKRKKVSLSSSDVNASLENSIMRKKEEENQDGLLETEKSSSITDSTRDSRRVAQVARQLVSLSEKKWWQ